MNADMSRGAATQIKGSMWLTNTKNFFHLPNPRIFTLFIVSSTATLSSGIAMIVQWVLHGQNQPGFHWMVYTASAITSLPILIWVVFLLFAIRFHESPPSDLRKSLQRQAQNLIQTTEAAAANDHDELAMVQIENILDDQSSSFGEVQPPVCKSPLSVNQPMISVDDKQGLKRTLSLPLARASTEHSNFKRTMSLKR